MMRKARIGMLAAGALIVLSMALTACSGRAPETPAQADPEVRSRSIKVYASPT
jgi:hypothetical protein